MRRCVVVVAMLACGCGSAAAESPRATRAAVRSVATHYLNALRRGDGAAACRLMSPGAMRSDGYATFAACARDHSHAQGLGRFRVVAVRLEPKGRAAAIVDDAAISDSGNDAIGLTREGSRWLIDAD